MEEPKISVIMPIHNTPINFLVPCLDSILKQTFRDFELICVDDCSDKNYIEEILNTYYHLCKEIKIRIIRQKKKLGAAMARNAGLKKASGMYVIFLDSDDIFKPNFLNDMFSVIVRNNADVCLCGYQIWNQNDENNQYENYLIDRHCLQKKEDFLCKVPLNPWSKLVKRELLIKERIFFQPLSSCNDVYYSAMIMLCADNVSIIDKTLITYRSGSPFQISANRDPSNLLLAVNKIRKDIRLSGHYKYEYENMLNALLINNMVAELRVCQDDYLCRKFYLSCKEYFKRTVVEFKSDSLNNKLRLLHLYEYDSYWFRYWGEYYKQLQLNAGKLIEELNEKKIGKKVIVWGYGKRGNAFIEWAQANSIDIFAVCDKQNNQCGERYTNNVKIISTEYVTSSNNALIIASNRKIYDLLSKSVNSDELVNLENYCPW